MSTLVYEQTLLESMIREQPLPVDLVKQAAREILDIIRGGLLQDGSVRINNFGTFRLKRHPQRQGRNPQTGETMTIAARNTVMFYPCKALRELIEPERRPAVPVAESAPASAVATAIAAEPRLETVATETPHPAIAAEPATAIEVPQSDQRRRYGYGIAAALVLAVVAFSLYHSGSPPPAQNPQPVAASTHAAPAPVTATAASSAQPSEPITATAAPPTQQTEPVATASAPAAAQPAEITAQKPATTTAQTSTSVASQAKVFFSGRTHRLTDGESLWRLAERSYQDPLLWPHIYQANINTIDNPDLLHTGATITLPTLEGGPGHLTHADRRNIAEGYYLTYLYYKRVGHKDAFFALLEAKRYSPDVVKAKRQRLHLSKLEQTLLDLQQPMPD